MNLSPVGPEPIRVRMPELEKIGFEVHALGKAVGEERFKQVMSLATLTPISVGFVFRDGHTE